MESSFSWCSTVVALLSARAISSSVFLPIFDVERVPRFSRKMCGSMSISRKRLLSFADAYARRRLSQCQCKNTSRWTKWNVRGVPMFLSFLLHAVKVIANFRPVPDESPERFRLVSGDEFPDDVRFRGARKNLLHPFADFPFREDFVFLRGFSPA